MDVHVVPAGQLASAILCQACILELLKSGITARMMAVHSATAKECVSTTLLLSKLPTWLPAGTAQPMKAHHMTLQLTVISRNTGIA